MNLYCNSLTRSVVVQCGTVGTYCSCGEEVDVTSDVRVAGMARGALRIG